MSDWLSEVDAWVTALLVAGAMFGGWGLGWWRGRRLPPEQRAALPSKLNDASLALLGLLLGFTFAMSLGKHDQRRLMVVTDSNAIGDFYTCVSLLKTPVRERLQALVRKFAALKLSMATDPLVAANFETNLRTLQELQNQMQALVGEAVDAGTPIVVPLVNTFNNLTSSHAARLAAVRDRLPASIVLLLVVAAVVSLVLVGAQQGAAGEHHPGATVGFVALVSLVVWVTLDLNQPRRGTIVVNQEPLQRVLAGIGE